MADVLTESEGRPLKQWFGIHRAVGGFLAKRVQDALAAAPGAGEHR